MTSRIKLTIAEQVVHYSYMHEPTVEVASASLYLHLGDIVSAEDVSLDGCVRTDARAMIRTKYGIKYFIVESAEFVNDALEGYYRDKIGVRRMATRARRPFKGGWSSG